MNEDGDVEKDQETLTPMERQYLESEKGYFLQPIYVQNMEKKIYLYDAAVSEMKNEFRDRLEKKRGIIKRMKHKCKELELKDSTLLCDRCHQDVSLLKTVTYISMEKHHAKCIFGYLNRVEELDVIKNADGHYGDPDSKGFIDIYLEDFKAWREADEMKEDKSKVVKHESKSRQQPLPKYAFCECRNHHVVGIIIDQRYYFTDVSPLQIMFP